MKPLFILKRATLVGSLLLFTLYGFAQAEDFEKKLEHARWVFHSTQFEKAYGLFDALIKENPDQAMPYAYAATIDMLLYKDATQNINNAKFVSKTTDTDHSFVLGLCHFANGELDECETRIQAFLGENPDDSFAYHILGFTRFDLGRPEEAKQTLEKLLEKDPAFYLANNHLGYAYLSLEQSDKAMQAFERFLEKEKLNPSAMDSFSEVLVAAKEYDKAIAFLSKAVLLEPDFAYGWKHMGDVFKQNGENELAIRAYEKAIESARLYGEAFTTSVKKSINKLKQ